MDYNPPPVLFRIVYKMELQDVLSVSQSWRDPHITAGQGEEVWSWCRLQDKER